MAATLGPASVITFLISAVLCTLLVLCFAEVGSRFKGTGGPMLYSHAAFGDMPGFLVGWLSWIVRITAWGALANGFVNAVVALMPDADALRPWLITGLIAALTAANLAGVGMGARVLNFFTAAKLIPIAFFIAIGLFHIRGDLFTPFAPHGFTEIAPATLVILYAFVGFEVLTVPAGEMRDPQRSVPRALLLVIALVTVVYFLIWTVCTGTLPTLAGADNPVADAARIFLGPIGGSLIAFGILLSVIGVNAGSALVAPRSLYVLGYMGYLPKPISSVHAGTRAPVVAILISSGVTLAIALSGSFVELAVISVVARFAQYIPTCLAVLYFRWKRPDEPPAFRTPGGPLVPVLALLLCGWLLSQAETRHLFWGAVALISGFAIYLPMRLVRGPQVAPRSEED